MNFFKLRNPIQNYTWGSKTAIQMLFDIENPNQEPQAEIWMGSHSNGCSEVIIDEKLVLLSEVINKDKSGVLSKATAKTFGELPYLFKVLAADYALSIQVHPNKKEAENGFAYEDAQGIERTAPNRNYRDPNHKPELVYALTPYKAMNGFRAFDEILARFTHMVDTVEMPIIQTLVESFKVNVSSQGLEAFFIGLLSLQGEHKQESLRALLEYATINQQPSVANDVSSLILELAENYSEDIGLFSPLILNVLTLKPGEAMYLDARTPHAYLKGTGLEVMANSDNVLRAGLTSKHIDVIELARCTLFEEKTVSSLLCVPVVKNNQQCYQIPVPDFNFDCFIQADDEIVEVNSAEIIFSIDYDTIISHISGENITIKKGESVFIPAYAKSYTISSEGRIARVYN